MTMTDPVIHVGGVVILDPGEQGTSHTPSWGLHFSNYDSYPSQKIATKAEDISCHHRGFFGYRDGAVV